MNGTFIAHIVNHYLAESKERTPSVKFQLELESNVANQEPATGIMWFDAFLTDAAFPYTMKTLTEAVGWDGTSLDDFQTDLFVGKKVWLVIAEETYQGKTRDKVKYMNPVDGGNHGIKGMETESAKALSEKLKGRVLAYRNASPKKVDDNFPF